MKDSSPHNLNDYPDKYSDVHTNRSLRQILDEYQSTRLLEIGSGVTTAVLSESNPTHFVSISTDKSRIKRAKQVLGACELPEPTFLNVRTVTVNLNCCTRTPILRLSQEELPVDEKFDFLFVNGPHPIGSRSGIMMSVEPRLSKGCIIVVNDFGNKYVKSSMNLWQIHQKKQAHREVASLMTIKTPRKLLVLRIS